MDKCCEVLIMPRSGEVGPTGIAGEPGIQGLQGLAGVNGLNGLSPVKQPLKFVRIFPDPPSAGGFTLTIFESELIAAGLMVQDVNGNIESSIFKIRVYVRHSTNPLHVWQDIRFNSSIYPSLTSIIVSQSGDVNVNINNPFFNNNFWYKIVILG